MESDRSRDGRIETRIGVNWKPVEGVKNECGSERRRQSQDYRSLSSPGFFRESNLGMGLRSRTRQLSPDSEGANAIAVECRSHTERQNEVYKGVSCLENRVEKWRVSCTRWTAALGEDRQGTCDSPVQRCPPVCKYTISKDILLLIAVMISLKTKLY